MQNPSMARSKDGANIAYHRTPGKSPGVMFFSGFMSDMTGTKALYLEEYCRRKGRAFLRFDYQGHGASSGAFSDGTISSWTKDALFALDELTAGPQILAGSSMGGWIMLLAAMQRPQRIAGLLGVAIAPDFTKEIIEAKLTDQQKEIIAQDGFLTIPSQCGDAPYSITRRLIEDGRHNLLLNKPILLACRTRLIHGMKDQDAPWQNSLCIAENLASLDVSVILVKEGGHRLSEPSDLKRLTGALEELIEAF